MGFAIPISDWIRGPLKNKVKTSVLNPIMADSGLFNMTNLKNIFEEHISGKFDHSPALWSLLMFEAFLRQSNSSTIAVA
jgi:asparagine synthase (glutamine-hydrolysing)